MVSALKMGKWLGNRRLTEKYFLGFCTSQQNQISYQPLPLTHKLYKCKGGKIASALFRLVMKGQLE